jgi:hypothetical protein
MRLKPVENYPRGVAQGASARWLHAALREYTSYYSETTGQTLDMWPLMVQMLERFVETDRDFLAWRRRTRNGPGEGPTTS